MSQFAIHRGQTIAALIRSVAQSARIEVADILSPKRARKYSIPRQFIMFMAFEMGFSLPRIGRILNRHHTTVLSGIRAERKRRGIK